VAERSRALLSINITKPKFSSAPGKRIIIPTTSKKKRSNFHKPGMSSVLAKTEQKGNVSGSPIKGLVKKKNTSS